jgi:hypothetical protein
VGYNHCQAGIFFFEGEPYVIEEDDKCMNFASLVTLVISFNAM